MAKSQKPKKISHALLITISGFLFLATLSALITFKQLHPSTALAANCTTTVTQGQNISNAINSAAPGSTICVAPGNYTENVYIDRSRTGSTLLSTQKWGAKIMGTPTATNHVAAIENNADDVTIKDFDVTGPNIKLGIAAEGNNNMIIGNHVHHIAMNTTCGNDGAAGIEAGDYRSTSLTSTTMNNLVDHIGTGQNCSYNQGIYHSQPSGKIINNIVTDVDAFCIHLWHHANNNYQIYNNTLINCGTVPNASGITIGAEPLEGGSVTGSTIANNIIINSPQQGIIENHASGNFYRNNMFYQVPSASILKVSCGTNNTNCSTNTVNNPLLDGSFRPMTNSPVIDKGYSSGAPTTDYEGKNRAGIPDIGAIESSGSQPLPTNTPTQQQPTATPRPNTTPTPTPRPQPTTIPQPTTPPAGNQTINFNSANVGPLTGEYPAGVITWTGSSWSISNPWEQLSSRNLGFRNSKTSQGNFNFKTPSIMKSIDAYNGTNQSSVVTITCGSSPKITYALASKKITTITTGFTTTCTTVTITSSNGWDTNFDNLTYK